MQSCMCLELLSSVLPKRCSFRGVQKCITCVWRVPVLIEKLVASPFDFTILKDNRYRSAHAHYKGTVTLANYVF